MYISIFFFFLLKILINTDKRLNELFDSWHININTYNYINIEYILN